MGTGKKYYDSKGQECSIRQMVRREPDWAANRVQEGEKAIARLEIMNKETTPIASSAEADRIIKEIAEILGHHPSDNKEAMTVNEALEFAAEWAREVPVYPGMRGWRAVCATLAAEVRRLRNGD